MYLKRNGPILLVDPCAHCCYCNYFAHQVRFARDWLIEKYNNDDVIVIDNTDKNEKDEATLAGFFAVISRQ